VHRYLTEGKKHESRNRITLQLNSAFESIDEARRRENQTTREEEGGEMTNARCSACGEKKDIHEFVNLKWNEEDVCEECRYNSPEAEEERKKKRGDYEVFADRTDPALLIEDIERRRNQLRTIKHLITAWEDRTGINLDGGINVDCPSQDFHLLTRGPE
jgi:hypothetical protein